MDDKIKRAKELYFEYCGNGFFMGRNGVWDEYVSCGATEEDESEWKHEMGHKFLNELTRPIIGDDTFHRLTQVIHFLENEEVLRKYVEIIDEEKHGFDTLTAVSVANGLIHLEVFHNIELTKKIFNLAEEVLKISEKSASNENEKEKIQYYMGTLEEERNKRPFF